MKLELHEVIFSLQSNGMSREGVQEILDEAIRREARRAAERAEGRTMDAFYRALDKQFEP